MRGTYWGAHSIMPSIGRGTFSIISTTKLQIWHLKLISEIFLTLQFKLQKAESKDEQSDYHMLPREDTYSFLHLEPSESRTSKFGRSLQSDPGLRGMCCIRAWTSGLMSLHMWSRNTGWCCFPRICEMKKHQKLNTLLLAKIMCM